MIIQMTNNHIQEHTNKHSSDASLREEVVNLISRFNILTQPRHLIGVAKVTHLGLSIKQLLTLGRCQLSSAHPMQKQREIHGHKPKARHNINVHN